MFIYSRALFVTTGLHELLCTGIPWLFPLKNSLKLFNIKFIDFFHFSWIFIKLTVLRMNLYSDQVGLVRLKISKNAVLFYSYPRLLILFLRQGRERCMDVKFILAENNSFNTWNVRKKSILVRMLISRKVAIVTVN